MKNFAKLPRAIITAAAIVVTLLLPMTTKAQNQIDGYFFKPSSDFTERDLSWEFVVVNQQFGANNESPLGSGLLILTAFGASYALLKKKED